MAHPDLTSHHVNYLIWRYLQESGHGEAAVMLQRAWNHDPQSLPFAPYIRTHALVSLVQKGLQYYELEKSLDKEGNSIPFSPSNYFFGPVPFELETQKGPPRESISADQAPVSPTGKVLRDGVAINGHSSTEAAPQNVKKSRKSDRTETNGNEVSMDVDSTNGVANESKPDILESVPPGETAVVDGDGDVSMGIRPAVHDQEPTEAPTFTLTTGHSIGVQITPAKAADLSPDTAIIDVAGDEHVTRTLWRPHDPTVVVAAGDTFCSLYKLSSASPPVQEKLVENKGDAVWVTAVAWEPQGQKLAVATYNDMRGSITTYDVAGNAVDLLPEVPRMISALKWANSGSQLIVVASDSKISELILWDDVLQPEEFPPPQIVNDLILDISWLGHTQAFACGGMSIYQCEIDSSIHLSKTFSAGDPEQPWTFIRCGIVGSSSVAVAASSSNASFWVPTHDLRIENAHDGDITAIQLKTNLSEQLNQPLILASSSTDDTVKLWHIDLESRKFDCIHRLSLGPSLPILANCFSPDGYALAAASKDTLAIWNAQRGDPPMATWKSPNAMNTSSEGKSPTLNCYNGSVEDAQDRSLTWDTDGKRLAFGFGSQLAIINLQR
ncbi:WD40 repeat domain-containing protein [Aspergillus lucknowensis]|uniref:WD40-repeat-containing domain protein n=1 Tax=Aspergillus lucknowensis TaxID=176173 RepID=A0ABR4LLY0_9EURO